MTDVTQIIDDDTTDAPDSPTYNGPVGDAKMLEAHEDGSEAWHEARKQGIGGSDAAKILGIQPYGTTRKELWRDKTGRQTPDPWIGGAAVEYGTRLEPHLRRWLRARAEDTPATYRDFGDLQIVERAFCHPERPWQRGNVDGICGDGETIVEIKTSKHAHGSRPGPDWRGDGVRRDHYAQIQHYLAVCGLKSAKCVYLEVPFDRQKALTIADQFIDADQSNDYWTWVIDEAEVTVREVERNDDYISDLTDAESDFWQHVQDDTEPPPFAPEGTIIVDDDDLAEKLDRYGRVHAQINAHGAPERLEDEKEELKSAIKDHAQRMAAAHDDAEEIVIEGTEDRVYWHGRGYWRADPEDRKPRPAERPDDEQPF